MRTLGTYIFVAVVAAIVALNMAEAVAAGAGAGGAAPNTIPVIRRFAASDGLGDTVVRRFEDGPNTCYVLTSRARFGDAVSISCVKR